jgi:hypothetical protein
MRLVEQGQNLPFHQPHGRRVSTQGSHAIGWDPWICRCMIHHGVTLSASPELHLHRQRRLPNLRPSASRLKRTTLTSLSNQQHKQEPRLPRDVKVTIWIQSALCKPGECSTIRFGAKASAGVLQSGRHRTDPRMATTASADTDDEAERRDGGGMGTKFYTS